MSGERDVLERLLDYDSCHDGDVDDAVVEIRSLRRQVATLREACRKAVDTADELMRNGAKNNVDAGIWGAAYTFGGIARAALAETEETP